VKARVGLQLKEVFLGQKNESTNKKRNLGLLAAQFEHMRGKIRQLIGALRAQHLSMLRMNETRLQVAVRVAALAEGSAICDEAGTVPTDHGKQESDLSSYMAVHNSGSLRQKTTADRFLQHIVDYAIEWEKVIVARVTPSLKKAETLRRDLDHYQAKVDAIKLEINKIISKGKMVDGKVTTRLQRNEDKFLQARNQYDLFSNNLCTLLEEVVVRGWKDLHPILIKLVQFDIQISSTEAELFSNLNPVVQSLKKIAADCGIHPQARLRELEQMTGEQPQSLHPNLLSSADLQDDSNDDNSDTMLPNATNDTNAYWSPTLTTSEMVSVAQHSAPPPTMDMVEESFRQTSVGSTSTSQSNVFGDNMMGGTAAPPTSNAFGNNMMHTTANVYGNNMMGGTASVNISNAYNNATAHSAGINPFGASISNASNTQSGHRAASPYNDSNSNTMATASPYGASIPNGMTTQSGHRAASPYREPISHAISSLPNHRSGSPYGEPISNTTIASSSHQSSGPYNTPNSYATTAQPPTALHVQPKSGSQTYHNPFD